MERQISEYKVVSSDDGTKKLNELVNQEIQKGWVPYGNLVVEAGKATQYTPWDSWYFYQPMVKYTSPDMRYLVANSSTASKSRKSSNTVKTRKNRK